MRWLIFVPIWLVALTLGVLVPMVLLASNSQVEVEVDARNMADDRLQVDVEGGGVGSLTGTAKFEDAAGNVLGLAINSSGISSGVITLAESGVGTVTTNLNPTFPTVNFTEGVTGGATATFTFGTDELNLWAALD